MACATAIGFCFSAGTSVESAEATRRVDSALPAALSGQYHVEARAVSPAVLGPVSAVYFPFYSSLYLRQQPALEGDSDRTGGTDRQYHEDPRVQLALGLGAVYALFLVGWVWATRVRPRRR
jgi:hypothetical protein